MLVQSVILSSEVVMILLIPSGGNGLLAKFPTIERQNIFFTNIEGIFASSDNNSGPAVNESPGQKYCDT
jgi:hypothetical protein